jgi:hypothetical protein
MSSLPLLPATRRSISTAQAYRADTSITSLRARPVCTPLRACLLGVFLLLCQNITPASGAGAGIKALSSGSCDGLQNGSRAKMRRRGGRRGQAQVVKKTPPCPESASGLLGRTDVQLTVSASTRQRRHYREWKAARVSSGQVCSGQTQEKIRDYHVLQKRLAQVRFSPSSLKSCERLPAEWWWGA